MQSDGFSYINTMVKFISQVKLYIQFVHFHWLIAEVKGHIHMYRLCMDNSVIVIAGVNYHILCKINLAIVLYGSGHQHQLLSFIFGMVMQAPIIRISR